jgi:hypothetical protein
VRFKENGDGHDLEYWLAIAVLITWFRARWLAARK